MIIVKRSKLPKIFKEWNVSRMLREAWLFLQKTDEASKQSRFEFRFDLFKDDRFRSALLKEFNGKCAYCEKFIADDDFAVDHFRPVLGALGFTREDFSKNHYWWLAYEWTNLNLSCSFCNQSKGNRFPVRTKRAREKANASELRKEEILILDPSGEIDPGKHLVFSLDGKVKGLSELGEVSIQVYGLNRMSLVEERKAEARYLHQKLILAFKDLQYSQFVQFAQYAVSYKECFSLMKNQLLSRWLSDPRYYFELDYISKRKMKFSEVSLPSFQKIKFNRIKNVASFQPVVIPEVSSWLNNSTSQGIKNTKAQLIERIEIENFKAIENISIQFSGNAQDKVAWKMLLGENGVGKTSILQAVTLALMETPAISNLKLRVNEFVRQGSSDNHLRVRIYLSGESKPIILGVVDGRFVTSAQTSDVLIISYGSVRFLGSDEPSDTSEDKVRNLFYSSHKIPGVVEWMITIDDSLFNEVARALKEILPIDEGGFFYREEGKILFKSKSAIVSLKQLSDGYQSLIAMSVDLMRNLLRSWPSLDVAEGIVLIDEIGVHMHPRWKMRIVKNLRTAFPRVQFLCSTHDPLCLRGLENNEVEVVERRLTDHAISLRTDLPAFGSMRVDQILTSEHFGLHSTNDPELDEIYQQYYLLMSKQIQSASEKKKILELREIIDSNSTLGNTRRERLAMKYIDELIANEIHVSGQVSLDNLRESTRAKIQKILSGEA